MKKVLMSLIVASVLLVSLGVVLADKPIAFDSQGNEIGWQFNEQCTKIQDGTLKTSDGNVITTGFDEWGYNYQGHFFLGGYCDAYRDAAWCQPYKDVKLSMKWNDAWLSNVDCDGDGLLDRHYGFDSYIGSGAWLTNHQSGSYEQFKYWDVSGNWVIAVNNEAYLHDYTFTMTSLEDGTFTGVGGYPAGAMDYSFDEIVVNGQITGDNIAFTATYYNPLTGLPTGYSWTATGTIAADGTLSGTGTSGVSEWHSTFGEATQISETCYWNYFVKIVAVPDDATLTDGIWYASDGTEIGPAEWGEFAIIQEVENDDCAGLHGLQYLSPTRAGLGNW